MPYGPRPREDRTGVDYYCGTCAGHKRVACDYCALGELPGGERCWDCRGVGEVPCPGCIGGSVPVRPPEWVPVTPRPPRCHHAETGENPGAAGAGRENAEASDSCATVPRIGDL